MFFQERLVIQKPYNSTLEQSSVLSKTHHSRSYTTAVHKVSKRPIYLDSKKRI